MMHEYSQICANKCASAKYGAWSSLVKMSTTQVTLEDSGNPLATLSAFGINDEECQVTNDGQRAQMREVHTRWAFAPSARWRPVWGESLWEASVNSPCLTGSFWTLKSSLIKFDCSRVYNYIINEEGQPMYLGSRSSVLFYNKTIPSWVWSVGQLP